jgi:lysophospholipase L1-like esterase
MKYGIYIGVGAVLASCAMVTSTANSQECRDPATPPSTKSRLVQNLEAGRPQTVVALGTSITANGAWVGHLSDALEASYPGLATVLNSGASGKNSNYGIEHFDRLVIQKKPDTMFIEYSINDCVERFDISVDQARKNLETLIDHTLKHFQECEIILMTMTPGNKYEPGHKSYRKNIEDHYAMVRAVALERGLLLIDHYPNWRALQQSDPALFKQYVPDTIHPKAEGNAAIVSPVILKALGIPAAE